MGAEISPEPILQLGLGFWASKTLLSAVELGLFTELAKGPMDAAAIGRRFDLDGRGLRDFLDALVSLGMLERVDGRYGNTPSTDLFLDRDKPSYIGGILEMANARLYPFWGSLTEALRTGAPQNEIKSGGDFFATLYADPPALKEFLKAMSGLSKGTAAAIAERLPWASYETVYDIGAAEGTLPIAIALAHSHMSGGGYDLPPVGPHFDANVAAHGLTDRLQFKEGDFLKDELPTADVLVMGHILHDWDLDRKRMLIEKAYRALPHGGALVVYEAMIDDARSKNVFGLLMSLNMLIETPGGFDYTGADCMGWMRDAGFRETRAEHLLGPDSMVIGIK
jgi:hypothetical protein